jgi:hypothetical protein
MRRTFTVVYVFALAALILHLATSGKYGYFRDELYFIDCGQHLDWGYVDHAPMIALLVKASRVLLGDSLRALRFLPAVASYLLVLLTGLIAIELGGGAFAAALACLGVALAPILLGLSGLMTMNAFEPLFWMGCVYVLLLAINRDNPKLLVWVGVLAGLGLETKHSTIFFLAALTLAVFITKERKLLLSPWMWLAAAIAFALFLPNLLWQYAHGWPTFEDLSNVRKMHKNVELSAVQFIGQQILILNPAALLVWGAGLIWLFTTRYRVLAWAYLAILGIILALHGKNYYLAPAYPMLFAAGGVFWERFNRLRWLPLGLVAASGVALTPLTLPILPVATFLRYQHAIGVEPPKTEVAHNGILPQHFGDQFGWPEMVRTVAAVYWKLSPEDRAQTAIVAGNYGEAGALNFMGPRFGLPPAISGHQTYWLWGPGSNSGEVCILLQTSFESARQNFREVEIGPELNEPYAMSEEHFHILIGRGLKTPLKVLWPKTKFWN